MTLTQGNSQHIPKFRVQAITPYFDSGLYRTRSMSQFIHIKNLFQGPLPFRGNLDWDDTSHNRCP